MCFPLELSRLAGQVQVPTMTEVDASGNSDRVFAKDRDDGLDVASPKDLEGTEKAKGSKMTMPVRSLMFRGSNT